MKVNSDDVWVTFTAVEKDRIAQRAKQIAAIMAFCYSDRSSQGSFYHPRQEETVRPASASCPCRSTSSSIEKHVIECIWAEYFGLQESLRYEAYEHVIVAIEFEVIVTARGETSVLNVLTIATLALEIKPFN